MTFLSNLEVGELVYVKDISSSSGWGIVISRREIALSDESCKMVDWLVLFNGKIFVCGPNDLERKLYYAEHNVNEEMVSKSG